MAIPGPQPIFNPYPIGGGRQFPFPFPGQNPGYPIPWPPENQPRPPIRGLPDRYKGDPMGFYGGYGGQVPGHPVNYNSMYGNGLGFGYDPGSPGEPGLGQPKGGELGGNTGGGGVSWPGEPPSLPPMQDNGGGGATHGGEQLPPNSPPPSMPGPTPIPHLPGGGQDNGNLPPMPGIPNTNPSWNPFTGRYNVGPNPWSGGYDDAFQMGRNWRPDMPEGGIDAWYQILSGQNDAVGDEEMAGHWGDYSSILTSYVADYLAPDDRDAFYNAVAPTWGGTGNLGEQNSGDQFLGGQGRSIRGDMALDERQRWDMIMQGLDSATGGIWGGAGEGTQPSTGDATEDYSPGTVDSLERTNAWLAQLSDLGMQYGTNGTSDYWSRSRGRERQSAWADHLGLAEAWGIDPSIIDLGDALFNPRGGTAAPSSYAYRGTGRYMGGPATQNRGGAYGYRNAGYT